MARSGSLPERGEILFRDDWHQARNVLSVATLINSCREITLLACWCQCKPCGLSFGGSTYGCTVKNAACDVPSLVPE